MTIDPVRAPGPLPAELVVALSRRGRSLAQRQLELIAPDAADRPSVLAELGHLATRIRRDNENLMSLLGHRSDGVNQRIADVLSAAVAEIEPHQRVVVQTVPSGQVAGSVAGDLTRLIAELLDNAAKFSAPETRVTVTARVFGNGGLLIDITDSGAGLDETAVAEANARLSGAVTGTDRLGLWLAGRLAWPHDIGVVLTGGEDIPGVRATVTVPAELVLDLTETVPFFRPPADAPTRDTVPLHRRAGLSANGHSGELQAEDSLFTASNTGDLGEQPDAAERAPEQEATPIFETVSAWFRAAPAASEQSAGWAFAADESYRAAQAVSQAEPASYTEAGLPRRRSGEQLMPGAIAPAGLPASSTEPGRDFPVRDAAGVRGRLSDFQRGINRARHAAQEQPPADNRAGKRDQDARGLLTGFRRGVRRGRHRAPQADDDT